MSYWDETDNYLRSHGGRGPTCPNCGNEMFPQDDHGRFTCFCSRRMKTLDIVSGTTLDSKPVLRVTAEADEKEKKDSGNS